MSEHVSVPQGSSQARVPGPPPEQPVAAAGTNPVAPLEDELVHLVEDAAGLAVEVPRLQSGRKGRRLARPEAASAPPFTPEQRLLLLDTWRRSGLPAGDFAALVGISKHTLYAWKQRFDADGPAGLMDQPRGVPAGSRLPELTKRAILMVKESHPDWGCQRISDALLRGPALPASAGAVTRVLHEAGYELEEAPTRAHAEAVHHFERARPNQLWQTDLFTFMLKRQNHRVYLVAFLDDHSRFVVGYGLHASQSSAFMPDCVPPRARGTCQRGTRSAARKTLSPQRLHLRKLSACHVPHRPWPGRRFRPRLNSLPSSEATAPGILPAAQRRPLESPPSNNPPTSETLTRSRRKTALLIEDAP